MTTAANTSNYLTIASYAHKTINERTGKPYSVKQIYRMIADGKVKGIKIDGKHFVVTN